MTFKQAQELGAHVRKGESGHLVVYANTITKTEEGENGQDEERKIPFMKGYTVFNVEQLAAARMQRQHRVDLGFDHCLLLPEGVFAQLADAEFGPESIGCAAAERIGLDPNQD
jgi:hypothetical protein